MADFFPFLSCCSPVLLPFSPASAGHYQAHAGDQPAQHPDARPDPHHVEILSLPACRRLLGKAGESVTDDELASVRDQLYGIALCAVEVFELSARDTAEATALDCLPADSREEVEERAAILQFDAKLSRDLASRTAVSAYLTAVKKGR